MLQSGRKGVELNLDQNLGGINDYYYYYNSNMSKTSSLSASRPFPLTGSALHRKWVSVKTASRSAHKFFVQQCAANVLVI
jgi:hypothetical protein